MIAVTTLASLAFMMGLWAVARCWMIEDELRKEFEKDIASVVEQIDWMRHDLDEIRRTTVLAYKLTKAISEATQEKQ